MQQRNELLCTVVDCRPAPTSTLTSANFTMPAVSATVNVQVASSSAFKVGNNVYIPGAGNMQITALPDSTHMTLVNSGVSTNALAGVVIASGAGVFVTGVPTQQDIFLFRPGSRDDPLYRCKEVYLRNYDIIGNVAPLPVIFVHLHVGKEDCYFVTSVGGIHAQELTQPSVCLFPNNGSSTNVSRLIAKAGTGGNNYIAVNNSRITLESVQDDGSLQSFNDYSRLVLEFVCYY